MDCPLVAPNADSLRGRCDWCGSDLPRLKSGHINPTRRWCMTACSNAYWSNHMWSMASAAARKRDGQKCVRCGSTHALEVNHIVPRRGGGYANGCHHHQDGLETLCRECHVRVTTAQLREWKYRDPPKPKGGTRPDRPPEARSLPLWEFAS